MVPDDITRLALKHQELQSDKFLEKGQVSVSLLIRSCFIVLMSRKECLRVARDVDKATDRRWIIRRKSFKFFNPLLGGSKMIKVFSLK